MEAIFAAIMKDEQQLRRVLQTAPDAHRSQSPEDLLIDAIPHWLYAGDVPLHLAAAALKPGVVEILLAHGADPNARNRRAATPLHYACDARPGLGGVWNPAAQRALIQLLVAHGSLLDPADRGGATPLHRAVRARSPSAVHQLLALGASPDCRLRSRGSTPLHLAAQSTGASGTAESLEAQLEIIALFRELGADLGARDDDQRTAYERATNPRVRSALSPR
ncbi:MAG TPA: ankyrin repeat domain-containing protein [Polyangiaceae bacterium]|nr:ankyrin repeat domain-containing protein [Polyangiaceae bacterium]